MDHYKVLGLGRNATKDEIKEAFRRLAVKFHPDKHSQSPDAVRENATVRFRQISEAYQTLSDDRKRAEYNIRSSSTRRTTTHAYNYSYHHHHHGSSNYYGSSSSAYSYKGKEGGGFVSKLETSLRYLTTRAFLLNLVFAGALLGGVVIIDRSRETVWKMQNSGKSFEEAMESIEKAKVERNKG